MLFRGGELSSRESRAPGSFYDPSVFPALVLPEVENSRYPTHQASSLSTTPDSLECEPRTNLYSYYQPCTLLISPVKVLNRILDSFLHISRPDAFRALTLVPALIYFHVSLSSHYNTAIQRKKAVRIKSFKKRSINDMILNNKLSNLVKL